MCTQQVTNRGIQIKFCDLPPVDISRFQSQSGQPYSCLEEAYVLHIP